MVRYRTMNGNAVLTFYEGIKVHRIIEIVTSLARICKRAIEELTN